jgi:hypothetical protein
MKVRKPDSYLELEQCVDIYLSLNDNSFYRTDREFCLRNIQIHYGSHKYIRVIEKNKRIVGFIMAEKLTKPFSREKFLSQQFYCSNLNGYSSARAVMLSHRDLIQEGIRQKVSYIESTAGPYDPKLLLVKILEHDGWIRKNYIAKYVL